MMNTRWVSCLFLFSVAFGDWPQFMPDGAMVSSETGLLADFPEDGLKTLWTRATGEGYAGPVVAGGKVLSFFRADDEEVLECLDAKSGALIWQRKDPTSYRDRYGFNGGPRSMPLIHQDRAYCYGAEGRLTCLQLEDGALLWQRSLNDDFTVKQNFFGVGSTPRAHGDALYVNVGGDDGVEVVALDTASGATRWAVTNDWGASYASPVLATIGGHPKLLVFAGGDKRPAVGGLLQIDLASQKLDYRFPWRCSRYESVNASSPLVIGSDVFVSWSILGGEGVMISSEGKEQWRTDKLGCYWMTPLHMDGHIYGIHGEKMPQAEVVCLNAKTGEQQWRTMPEWIETVEVGGAPRELKMSIGRGTLLAVDGKVLCVGENGHLLWLKLSPDGLEVLDRTWLFQARETWSAPVVADRRLYLQQHTVGMVNREPMRLHCFDLNGK